MQDQVQTLAGVTKEARMRAGLSMRGLAWRSGLSAAQIRERKEMMPMEGAKAPTRSMGTK
jgi:hypothetical protein